MKVPDTLEGLLDVMRARGVATFEWEERGEGGTVLKHALSMEARTLRAWRETDEGEQVARAVDATPQDITRGHDATAKPIEPRVSDIDLALNPPALDYDAPDEGADIDKTVASLEAPRESAPVGAAEPDDSP